MKKLTILSCVFLLFCQFNLSAQKRSVYTQKFEGTADYTVKGPAATETDHYVSSTHSMRMTPDTTQNVYLELPGIKINSGEKFARLGFKHIAKINPNQIPTNPKGAYLQYRKANETNWVNFANTQYDNTWGGGMQSFDGYFNVTSYTGPYSQGGWGQQVNDNPTNDVWKQEYFEMDFANINFTSDSLVIRFVLPKHKIDSLSSVFYGWLLDDIQIDLSPEEMRPPVIIMQNYPNPVDYPANVPIPLNMDIYDNNIEKGLLSDSLYFQYKYGNGNWEKLKLTQVGANTYTISIPFKGYDALIQWRVVACDASSNKNKTTFPIGDSLMQLKYVRSVNNDESLARGDTSTRNYPFPFYYQAARSQYIYTAQKLKEHGYKAGNIDELFFDIVKTCFSKTKSDVFTSDHFTIKMGGARLSENEVADFISDANLITVFDGTLTMPETAGWTSFGKLITPFKWNGETDIIIQLCYTNTDYVEKREDQPLVSSIPNDNGMNSYTKVDLNAKEAGCNLSPAVLDTSNTRPDIKFHMVENPPLDYDLGFVGFKSIDPKINSTDQKAIQIILKNYGTKTLNSAKIKFQVDEEQEQTLDWIGDLPFGQTQDIEIIQTRRFLAGYKIIKVWIDSTSLNGNNNDYEPLNNKIVAKFVSCDGPISGPKTIKKSKGDYPSIQGAIEVMRYCGIIGPVTFTVEKGEWNEQLKFYNIQGLSATNNVVFKRTDIKTDSVFVRYTLTKNNEQKNLLNIDSVKYVTFENIVFALNSSVKGVDLARITNQTSFINFKGCGFISDLSGNVNILVNAQGANRLSISNSNLVGGGYGIYLSGATSQNKSNSNLIDSSSFTKQTESAIYATYQDSLEISTNKITFDGDEGKNAIFISESKNKIKILRNQVFSSKGAKSLNISEIYPTDSLLIINNMFSKFGNGEATVKIKGVDKLRFIYNTLVANATIEASSSLLLNEVTNSMFYDNIIYSQSKGFAINYTATQTSNNIFNNNSYYSATGSFGKYNAQVVSDFNEWKSKVNQDYNSLFQSLKFASQSDLRTYDKALLGKGMPINYISTDIYGSPRAVQPYIGAFETGSLNQNISLEEIFSPLSSCYLTTQEKVSVNLKNIGTQDIATNAIQMSYQILGNSKIITQRVGTVIKVDSNWVFTFDTLVNLSVVNYQKDSIFKLKVWATLLNDPDHTNDTILNDVRSNYQLPAPIVSSSHSAPIYAQSSTINITGWSKPETLYWFLDSLSNTPVGTGTTYTTPPLFKKNNNFYVAQKSEKAIIKITEVQINRTKKGAISPPPTWLKANTAIEISNLGNKEIDLNGYKLEILDVNMQQRVFTFTSSFILNGNSTVVIQYIPSGNPSTTPITIYTPNLMTLSATESYGITLYNSKSEAIDALIINRGKLKSNVPDSIWKGTGVTVTANSPGIRRTIYRPNTASAWKSGTELQPMTLGTIDISLVQMYENGCYGYKTPITLAIANMPTDLAAEKVTIPEDVQSCGLGQQPITITIRNLSEDAILPGQQLTIGYFVEGKTSEFVTEQYAGGIPAGDTVSITFTSKIDFSVTQDKSFTIKAYVNYTHDLYHVNDTVYSKPINSYAMPHKIADTVIDDISFGTNFTIKLPPFNGEGVFWYNLKDTTLLSNIQDLNVGYLFEDTTFLVKPYTKYFAPAHVGKGTDTSVYGLNSYPVYNTDATYSRKQYLVMASDLKSVGYDKGIIGSLSFFVQSIEGDLAFQVLDTFKISLAPTDLFSLPSDGQPFVQSSFIKVYEKGLDTIRKGQQEHVFNTPYIWDGETNLLVEVFLKSTNNTRISVKYAKGEASIIRSVSDCRPTPPLKIESTNIEYPQMQFGFAADRCVGDLAKVDLKLDNTSMPDYDLGITEIVEPFSDGNIHATPLKINVKNYGKESIKRVAISYTVNGGTPVKKDSVFSNPLTQGKLKELVFESLNLNPGKHIIKVSIDSIFDAFGNYQPQDYTINDTISKSVRYCMDKKIYTIGAGKDFLKITDAIAMLKEAGICDTVIFKIANGTYNEQLIIPEIAGTSDLAPVIFTSESGNRNNVILSYTSIKSDSNFVVRIIYANHIIFKDLTINAGGSIYGRALEYIGSSSGQVIKNCIIKGTASFGSETNKALVYIYGSITEMMIDSTIFDGGDIGIHVKPDATTHQFTDFKITKNTFKSFAKSGIDLERATYGVIEKNTFTSSSASVGISLKAANTLKLRIGENIINLMGGSHSAKGIELSGILATESGKTELVNNMISLKTTSTAQLRGIDISNVSNLNIYFNTVRVENISNVIDSTKVLSISNGKQSVEVFNNILSSFSPKGYAYYVPNGNSDVAKTDYNNYYVKPSGTPSFAYWDGEKIDSLLPLQVVTGMEKESMLIEPFYLTESNLRVKYNDFFEKGYAIGDVNVDIDGQKRDDNGRARPSMGAYEYPICNRDIAIVRVLTPVLNNFEYEGDSIAVQIEIKNIGSNTLKEDIPLKAYVVGLQDTSIFIFKEELTNNKNANPVYVTMPKIYVPYGKRGATEFVVYSMLANDCYKLNDTIKENIQITYSYDVAFDSIWKTTIDSCNLKNEKFTIRIKNTGRKSIVAGNGLHVGARVTGTISGNPINFDEQVNLGMDTILPGQFYEYPLNKIWNIYPTGTNYNVNIIGWTGVKFDGISTNDTAKGNQIRTIKSYPLPDWPKLVGQSSSDTLINMHYATSIALKAYQKDDLPISWYTNVNNTPFKIGKEFTTDLLVNSVNYYLQVINEHQCKSIYDTIQLKVASQPDIELACEAIIEPTSKVYMESGDFVSIRVKNYGRTPAASVKVWYYKGPDTSGYVKSQLVGEIIPLINPGETVVYKFSEELRLEANQSGFALKAWLEAIDAVQENDTAKMNLTALQGENYCDSKAQRKIGLDIAALDYGKFHSLTPAIGTAYYSDERMSVDKIFYKGYQDTFYVTTEISSSGFGQLSGGTNIYIDYNRDGKFTNDEVVYSKSNNESNAIVKISETALTGYTRMRVVANAQAMDTIACGQYPVGETQDFKIYIRDPYDNNAEIESITWPNQIINASTGNNVLSSKEFQTESVKVKLRNLGSQLLSNVVIKWQFNNEEVKSKQWSGALPSMSVNEVVLDNYNFPFGPTNLKVWVEQPDKNVDPMWRKDTIAIQFYRHFVVTAPYQNNFDEETDDYFYAPKISTITAKKSDWERGELEGKMGNKAVTPPNVWATNLEDQYEWNNQSILYTPIFNTASVKPDTLSFYLRKDMGKDGKMYIEYMDATGVWRLLGEQSSNWYDTVGGFYGKNTEYKLCIYSLKSIISYIDASTQFRFVFESNEPQNGVSTDTMGGEGIAIDNFSIMRIKSARDVGVKTIQNEYVMLGSTIYPQVTIKNYGTASQDSIPIYYSIEGTERSYIPAKEIYTGKLEPGDTVDYVFRTGCNVDKNFVREQFALYTYTGLNQDYYRDNDTAIGYVFLQPSPTDVGIITLLAPSTKVIAGEEQYVSLRLKNFGTSSIDQMQFCYELEGQPVVKEEVSLSEIVNSFETFEYTFQKPFITSLGSFKLKTWVKLLDDVYKLNDTLSIRLTGGTGMDNLKADYIVLKETSDSVSVQFTFINTGTNGIYQVPVSYYIDGDRSTMVTEIFEIPQTIPVGKMGSYIFKQKLPKRTQSYAVCAFTSLPTDNNTKDDTTCVVVNGWVDALAAQILVEENNPSTCKVQVRVSNRGNAIIKNPEITVVNKNTGNVLTETFEGLLTPGDTIGFTFVGTITSLMEEASNYILLADIKVPGDVNPANDTTSNYKIVRKLGIEDEEGEPIDGKPETIKGFSLSQNTPNPFTDETRVVFRIPDGGTVKLFMYDIAGHIVFERNQTYPKGENSFIIKATNLATGTYFYGIEYKGVRLVKKLIIQK